jgi:segregation and condensation protein B
MSEPESTQPLVLQAAPHLLAAVEAILLAADRPLTSAELAELATRVDEVEVPEAWIEQVLAVLVQRYSGQDRGFHLMRLGAGWEFRTRGAYADYVHALYRRRPVRLSRAALEVLATVAYRQPCTRADIDEIRGVDSSGVLRQLLERELIRIIGKSDDVGRPLIYGTTPRFLAFFGLSALSDLPPLREFTELSEDHLVRLQALEETLVRNATTAPAPAEGATHHHDLQETLPLDSALRGSSRPEEAP